LRRVTFQTLFLLIVLLALALGGCGDSDEVKGQHLLTQAETLLEQGDDVAAEVVLTDLLAQYPSSQAAVKGRKQLQSISDLRKERASLAFSKILNSYIQVLDGYRAMYSEFPRSIATLDESDYFFDSSYLNEITPKDYQVYLLLQGDGSGYRLWCVNTESDRGYAVDTDGKKLLPFEPVKNLAELKTRFRAETWDAKFVTLSSI
jgi:hypothetical protein